MARRRRIDARCDDGGGLLGERVGLEGDPGERSDVSRAQGFTRGDGAGQHHRALSTLGIFVPMGVVGFSARVLRGSVVMCHRGFGRPLGHRSARRAPNRGDVGPREGQEGEEGDGALHEGRCWGGVGGTRMGMQPGTEFHTCHMAPLTVGLAMALMGYAVKDDEIATAFGHALIAAVGVGVAMLVIAMVLRRGRARG